MKKLIRILLIIVIVFPFYFVSPVYATDISVAIDLIYSVNSQGIMHIKEVRTVRNNSSKFYIPATSKETFIISTFKTRSQTQASDLQKVSKTIKLTDLAGQNLNPTINITENRIEAEITFGSDLQYNQAKTFVLEYDNFELVEKNGNIWNVYVPGLPEGYDETTISANGASTQTSYSIDLEIDKSLGDPSFVLPSPSDTYEAAGKVNYIFNTETLEQQSAWIQIGNKQYYSFTITQAVEASQSLGAKVFNTWYDLILPRDSDSRNQKVYFKSITPEPQYVRVDDEGNVVARFTFTGEENATIIVKGFIVANITEKISEDEIGGINAIDLSKHYATIEEEDISYSDLLSAQKFWEVDAHAIQVKASDLMGKKTNALQVLLSDYNFVTQNVDYDNLKTGINNQRQGALSTLKGGSSVCMEYSDLLITLLRAQGIPARASFGYGFDPKSEGETEEGHQWVEAYMPNIGWVAVDPTWGDTGRRSYIGGDVDHALWYVAGLNVETPSPVVKYSFSDTGEVAPPKFEIKTHENANLENLMSLDELLNSYKYTPTHKLHEQLDRLNIYGKVLFIGIPAIIILLLLILSIFSIVKIIKKITSKPVVIAKPAGHDVPNNPYY